MLGDAFLRGWYSTYDYEKKLMGFAPHATSTKAMAVKGSVPSESLPGGSGTDWVLIAVMISLGVLVLVLAIVLIWCNSVGKLSASA